MAATTLLNSADELAIKDLSSDITTVNARGFPALPSELYLEILGNLPARPIPHDVCVDKPRDPYRQLTLYYLSQTCRSLREFFLKYAWERIEVFKGMWTPVGRVATKTENGSKMLVEEIHRQLHTVIVRNPDLRQYVSIVDLTIVKYSHKSVIPEVAQSLSLFSNLHTLQLDFLFQYPRPPKIFSEFRYPNVHTLNLSGLSPYGHILQACPNTKHFSFYKDNSGPNSIWELFNKECSGNIEKVGVVLNLHAHLRDIVSGLPRLRDISLTSFDLGENLKHLSSLSLHTIRLRLDTPRERQSWIDLAKEILAKCPQDDVVKRVMVNYDKTVEVYRV